MQTITRPRREPEIELNLLPDGYTVLYSPRTNLACTLTPLASLVWEFCDGSNTAEDIFGKLAEIDELPQNSALRSEIDTLLKELTASGLIYSDED